MFERALNKKRGGRKIRVSTEPGQLQLQFASPATIRSHLENAFTKIGAHTRTEAIALLDDISRPPRPERT